MLRWVCAIDFSELSRISKSACILFAVRVCGQPDVAEVIEVVSVPLSVSALKRGEDGWAVLTLECGVSEASQQSEQALEGGL